MSVGPKNLTKELPGPTKELPRVSSNHHFEVQLAGVKPGVKLTEYELNRKTNIFGVRSSIAGGRY